jgi:hypothetical protein
MVGSKASIETTAGTGAFHAGVQAFVKEGADSHRSSSATVSSQH